MEKRGFGLEGLEVLKHRIIGLLPSGFTLGNAVGISLPYTPVAGVDLVGVIRPLGPVDGGLHHHNDRGIVSEW